jgi:hypothetical protein
VGTPLARPHQQQGVTGIAQGEDHQGQQVEPEVAAERLECQAQRFLRRLGGGRLPQPEDKQAEDEQPRQHGDEEERPQVARPQQEEPGCQQGADGGTEMVHRPVEPESSASDRGAGGVGDQGVPWRGPHALAGAIPDPQGE